jgi:putative DNA primase/helicase
MASPTFPRPVALPLSPDHIPKELKVSPQFVGWRYELRDDKWTKPPVCVETGEHASSTDLNTCATYELTFLAYRNDTHQLDGIGYVLVEHDNIVGFDFDHCRNPDTGEIDPWALELVRQLDSYTEVSPSGTGLRVWTYGTFADPKQGRKRGDIEMYRGQRFLTLTGCHLDGTPPTIEPRQEAINTIYKQFFHRPDLTPGDPQTNRHTSTLKDDILLERALNARNGGKLARLLAGDIRGYPSTSEADLALCSVLAFWTQDPEQINRLVCRSALFREKWERADYRDATIAKALGNAREHWRGGAVSPTNGQPGGPTHHTNGHSPTLDVNEDIHGEDIHLTDVGNGLRLVQQFGHDLRYVITWKKWIMWHGGRWVVDEGALVEWRAKQVIAGLYAWAQREVGQLAENIPEDEEEKQQRATEIAKVRAILKWAHDSENGTHIDLMVKRARVNPKVQLRHDQLDVDPMLFQCANGTIDLRTSERREPQRGDYITKQSPVIHDPDAICPRWMSFLQRIQGYPQANDHLSPNERGTRVERADRMITYLKRLVGMSLTGDITEQQLQFLYGTGQNGKSTFLNTILALLGDYGMQAAPNFLLVREHEQHPTELTDLFGKRFVSTIEIEKGKELAEALMKTLTGSENVRARRMREDFWQFPPTWKVWLAANDKPKVKGRDKATWRRIKLIPFEVTIPDEEVDHDLPGKLLEELPGILNWAIEGCQEWKDRGLEEPEEVTRATEAYREETDILGQFVHECCVKPAGTIVPKTQSSVLHKAFDAYAGTMLSPVGFADLMKASGYKKKTIEGKVYWVGIGLKTSETDAKSKAAGDTNNE